MEILDQSVRRPPEHPLDPSGLAFASLPTPNMFRVDWDQDRGWHDARLVPYADFSLSPASLVLHYGQEIFEGLKAYRHADRSVKLFRPDRNAARLNRSAARLCMPEISVDDQVQAMKALIDADRDWMPPEPGTMYVRPAMIATEAGLGVRPAKQYAYFIITAASGPYFQVTGRTLRIWVERKYARAAPGGTGAAKTGGNYAGSLLAAAKAAERGCDQVMWLDAVERRFVEECGAMNLMFVLDGVVTTPPTSGTILEGVTRESVAVLCSDLGIPFAERPVAVEHLIGAIQTGSCTEVFSCGTAAVLTPIGELVDGDKVYQVADGNPGPIGQRLYETLKDLQFGRGVDKFGWLVTV
jgi:branched-chain amino acid aminotransferase